MSQGQPRDADELWQQFKESVGETETRLGITPGTLVGVFEYPDWSFVVALSALLESAATGLLQRWIGHAELNARVRAMHYVLKLEWLAELGLQQDAVTAARAVANVRNRVAHSIEALTNFSLPSHLANPKERHKLVKGLKLDEGRWSAKVDPKGETLADMMLEASPKTVMLIGAAFILDSFAAFDWTRRGRQAEGRTPAWLQQNDPEFAEIHRDSLLDELDRHYSGLFPPKEDHEG